MEKLTFHNFQYYETDEMENYLEKMALDGYVLESMRLNYLKFSSLPTEKSKYYYKVIYTMERNVDGIMETMKDTGWEYVCQNRYLLIFKTAIANNKATTISEQEKYKTIHNIRKSKILLVGFLTALLSIFSSVLYVVLFNKYIVPPFSKELVISSFPFLVGGAVMLGFLIHYAGEFYDYINWNTAAQKALKDSTPVSYQRTAFKNIMFHIGSLYGAAVIAFAVILSIYMLVSHASLYIIAFVCFSWFILIICTLMYSLHMKGSFIYLSITALAANALAFAALSMAMSL